MAKQLADEEIEKAKREHKLVPKAEELEGQLMERAEKVIQWYLLRDRIIQKEKLEITEEKMKAFAEKHAESMGVSPEVLMKYYEGEEMKRNLLFQEVQDFLREKNTISKIPAEEYKKKEEERANIDANLNEENENKE
jgi:FKBP-type peptidyl-prolyl cis-trans isomerase (trigger factor)